MSRQAISVGTSANDGTGDPVRTAGQKINANFEELYSFNLPINKARKILGSAFRGKLVPVMANPVPTVTQGGLSANSTIITDQNIWGAQINWDSPHLTYYSGLISDAGWWGWINSPSASAGTGGTIRFATDAEAFELKFVAVSGPHFRVMVDGEWTSQNDYQITGDGSQFVFYKIDFGVGSSRPRVIDVSFDAGVYQMLGMNIGPSAGTAAENNPYRIWKAPLPDESRALVWGDSWVTGVGIGSTNCRAGMVHKCGEYLGIKSIIGSGVGSSGYLAVGNDGSGKNFRQRLTTSTPSDIERFGELDLIIVGPTGMNDVGQGFSPAQVQAEASLFAQEIITRQPNALIAAFGPQRSPAITTSQAMHDAIRDGWLAAPGWDANRMAFLPTFSPQNWFDISTTVGNMTDSIYNTSVPGDDGHVNQAGHIYTGRRMADAIIGWLNTLVP
jgi:lysophospholipase L1-like esterase